MLQPDVATAVGDHRFDDRWPDVSEAGRLRAARLRRPLDGPPDRARRRRPLPRRARSTATSCLGELDALRFAETELREEAWDPLALGVPTTGGLHALLAREFAPLAVRLTSVAREARGHPGRDRRGAARHQGGVPDRPVPRLHAEVAAQRIGGVDDLGARRSSPRGLRRPTRPGRRGAAGAAGVGGGQRRGRPRRHRSAPGRGGRAGGRPGDPAIGHALFAAQAPPHDARPVDHPRGDPRAGRSRVRGRPRRDGRTPARPGRRGAPASRSPRTRARSCGSCWTRSPSSIPPRTSSVAYSREELERVEAFCGEHAGHRARRRAARDRLDPRVHALVRRGDARRAEAARHRREDLLLDHAAAAGLDRRGRRVVPA